VTAGPAAMPAEASTPAAAAPLSLRGFAYGAAAALVQHTCDDSAAPEMRYLLGHLATVAAAGPPWFARLAEYLACPAEADIPLLALGQHLGMSLAELLATALAAAVEDDPMAGRAIAFLQAPSGGSRPTLALAATVLATFDGCAAAFDEIAAGPAQRSGLLDIDGTGPMPERVLCVPSGVAPALRRVDSDWPGVTIGMGALADAPLPGSILEDAARHAHALSLDAAGALAIRSGSAMEARVAACEVARRLRRQAAFIGGSPVAGFGAWLFLRRAVPVFCLDLAPGEHHRAPDIGGYRGPVLAICGPDGSIESRGESARSWRLPTPPGEERRGLWEQSIGDAALARTLASEHRHSSGRIAELGRGARHLATLAGRTGVVRADIAAAARLAQTHVLGALAQPIADDVPDEALVVPAALRAELDALAARCRERDRLADDLGPAARARYHPGVRALFVGPSGTGKTLAASWLATRLAVPLYRVDLAAVTSKYIGETEKHLAQLMARAEHAEIALLFDEADSLFGKRTEVKDSNDRFANAQTNYLLQRIETFDGIAILTSNSRARFDSAFTRRLDVIVDFPSPGPDDRRALWVAHLGTIHRLAPGELNQLAATADLSGGHIRNAVFAAAAAAHDARRTIEYEDVVRGVAAEYRKLGRQLPADLAASIRRGP
jgi:histone H3/H4